MLVMLFADSDPIAWEQEYRAEPGEDPTAFDEEQDDDGTPVDRSEFSQLPSGF
jgi:hypothetical protein